MRTISILLSGLLIFLLPETGSAQLVSETWPGGSPRYEGEWQNGLRIGKHKWWHENGEKRAEVNFSPQGKPLVCYTWDEKGEIMDEIEFEYQRHLGNEMQSWKEWDTLPGGVLMHFIPLKIQAGAKPAQGSKVAVRYTGALADGSVFEENFEKGKPLRFHLGRSEVIPGFDQAVSMLKLYEKAVFFIPAGLAYGDRLVGNIPPGSALYYTIEIVEIEE